MSNKIINVYGRRLTVTKEEIESGLLLTRKYAVGLNDEGKIEIVDLRGRSNGRRLKLGSAILHASGKYQAIWNHNKKRISLGYYGTAPMAYNAVRRFITASLLKLKDPEEKADVHTFKEAIYNVIVDGKSVSLSAKDVANNEVVIKGYTHSYINGKVRIYNKKGEIVTPAINEKYDVALTPQPDGRRQLVLRMRINGYSIYVGKYWISRKAEEAGDKFVHDILEAIDKGEVYGGR